MDNSNDDTKRIDEIKEEAVERRGPGRPRGATAKYTKPKVGRPRGKTPKTKLLEKKVKKLAKEMASDIKLYSCSRCGKQTQAPINNFYLFKASELYVDNDGYTTICVECIKDMYNSMKIKYKDEKVSFIIICHYLDIFYDDTLFNSLISTPDFTIGKYIRSLNMYQSKNKNFVNYFLDMLNKLDVHMKSSDKRVLVETKWGSGDLKNRQYVVTTIGYDCFDDESYNDDDRKFLFNTLADYLTDEIIDDPHKVQRVITLVKNILQEEKIDRMLNAELKTKLPDKTLIKSFTDIKQTLSTTIEKIANENAISAKTSGKISKNSNTLTNMIKQMIENNFDDVKINIVDVKMSEAYKRISEQNAKALFNELNYQSDDYARLLSEQAQFVEELQNQILWLEEENRMLKICSKQVNKNGDL